MKKEISPQGMLKCGRVTLIQHDTHCNHLWVDAQVFPIPTAYISQHAASWERRQELGDARPGRVASAAEVGGNGVVHLVHIFLLQTGCIGMATGNRGGRW